MDTVITILVDNTPGGRGTVAEHGFAVWISRGDTQILFDTGAGNALSINAKHLKKDFHTLHQVVLSHGHWDHTGGLPLVLTARETTEIRAHPAIFDERFAKRMLQDAARYRSVGMPFSREELEQAGARFMLCTDYHEMAPGIWFSGETPRPEGWQSLDPALIVKRDKGDMTDPISDDISLLIETGSGPVVLLGCAHAGTEIILEYLAAKSGHEAFCAVIGGTHLMHSDEQRIDRVIEALKKYQVQRLAAMHCTGFPAMVKFSYYFGEQFELAHVGTEFHF